MISFMSGSLNRACSTAGRKGLQLGKGCGSCSPYRGRPRAHGGFTLTEMLVTMLILTLAASLLATGVPVAIDTYHKTVKSANAQLALSTSVSVLRSELGLAREVRVVDNKIYFETPEDMWACIRKPEGDEPYRGLVKEYLSGQPATNNLTSKSGLEPFGDSAYIYPLVADKAITEPLHVTYDAVAPVLDDAGSRVVSVTFTNLRVVDEDTAPNTLAETNKTTGSFTVLTRFTEPSTSS